MSDILGANAQYSLNRMNSTARKHGLGDVIEAAGDAIDAVEASVAALLTIKAKGNFTTVGGDATEVITVASAVATDLVFINIKTAGATPRTIVDAAAGTGDITVELSGDPSNDHVLSYIVVANA